MATKKWKISGATGREADTAPTQSATIYDEAELGLPPAGPYRCVLKQLKVGETSGEPAKPKLSMVFEIAEPEGTKKAKYNGYGIWRHQTCVPGEDDGRVNALLEAMFDSKTPTIRKKVRAAFWKVGPDYDSDTDLVLKIGGVAVDTSGIPIGVNTRFEKGTNGYADKLTAAAVFGESKVKVGAKVDPDDEPEDDDEVEDDEAAEDVSEEEAERTEELEAMTLAALRKEAKANDIDTAGLKKEALIESILDVEFGDEEEAEDDEPDDEEDDEEEASEEDERREELAELSLAKLKAEAKSAGLKITQYKGLDAEGIIDLIIGEEFPPEDEDEPEEEDEATEEEDEDDEEDEPEPAPARRRGRTATKAAPAKAAPARRRRSARGGDDEPPF